jgi:hypothetical protein
MNDLFERLGDILRPEPAPVSRPKRKWTTPDLLVDDHHGVYMMHLLVKGEKQHRGRIYHELQKNLNPFALRSLLAGPDDEGYWEACDRVTQLTFTTPTGQKYVIDYVEGGLWAIPFCFRGKAREAFYGG